jgi:hypothetical protein
MPIEFQIAHIFWFIIETKMEAEENLVGVRNERKKSSPKRVKFRRKEAEGNLMGVEGNLTEANGVMIVEICLSH